MGREEAVETAELMLVPAKERGKAGGGGRRERRKQEPARRGSDHCSQHQGAIRAAPPVPAEMLQG